MAEGWSKIGGFDEQYQGYGAEDTDFAMLAQQAGVELTWVGGASAFHQWHPTASPPVRHLDDILRNGALFATRWGWWPMESWLEQFEAQALIRSDGAGGWLEVDGHSSPAASGASSREAIGMKIAVLATATIPSSSRSRWPRGAHVTDRR
jgi:hypothetical protein